MTPGKPYTAKGYIDGKEIELFLTEVECGKFMRSDLVHQVQEALAAARADHIFITISSCFRTWDEQDALYRGFKDGRPGFNPADPPGYSKHQSGIAIDMHAGSGDEQERLAAIAEGYSMGRPHPHEPWHFEAGRMTPSPITQEELA